MARAIMIQGTMSNVGKSFLAAGLCRIFFQDGYRVAPFKAQNMALNSFITKEGLEIGRAQAVQAEAAGIEPEADMNPILLKPSSDTGSQVIVHGIPVGTMPAREYFRKKKALIPAVMESYRRLNEAYDIIVIEGAGSPAEINLKQDDIVNMGMARLAGAPVLLTGDIDPGGVFAQLYGTVMLLSEKERAMIKGLLINKFRGDRTILDPGVEMIESLCKIPVAGVIPYMDVDLEDEDSLSGRLLRRDIKDEKQPAGEGKGVPLIEIAAIRFPRLSNFTDLNVFSTLKGIRVRYVDRVSELGNPDLIVLPGTKNTVEDLRWMRRSGLESAVKKAAFGGTPVWGICGGYQMMGEYLLDEEGAESGISGCYLAGMGLLPGVTRFYEAKTRTRVRGRFDRVSGIFSGLSGMEAEGYEIHMGRTDFADGLLTGAVHSLLRLTEYEAGGPAGKPSGEEGGIPEGCFCGNIYGTYLHGIFDAPGVAEVITNALLIQKGYDMPGALERAMDYRMYREAQYDRLASVLREHLDLERIYRILEQGEVREEKESGLL